MACENNMASNVRAAGANGITKSGSKSAYVAAAGKSDTGKQRQNGANEPERNDREKTQRQRTRAAQNVKAFYTAMQNNQRVSVLYRPIGGSKVRMLKEMIPLDVAPVRGLTLKGASGRNSKYMWVFTDNQSHPGPLCLRLDHVIGVKPTASSFDPKAISKSWTGKPVKWTLPRNTEAWGGANNVKSPSLTTKPSNQTSMTADRPPKRAIHS